MNLDEKEFLIGMTGLISEYNTHFISINELISMYYMYTYLHIKICMSVCIRVHLQGTHENTSMF